MGVVQSRVPPIFGRPQVLVAHQRLCAANRSATLSRSFRRLSDQQQSPDEFEGGDEENTVATLYPFMPQGGDQVGLPSAGQAEDQNVLGPIDELALAQLGELTANAQGQPLLVEGLQGLAGREVRCFAQTQDAPFVGVVRTSPAPAAAAGTSPTTSPPVERWPGYNSRPGSPWASVEPCSRCGWSQAP